jgi:hypothetical protein
MRPDQRASSAGAGLPALWGAGPLRLSNEAEPSSLSYGSRVCLCKASPIGTAPYPPLLTYLSNG